MIRCWLFDVDGTLANNDHRKHHLEKTPKDWDAFFAGAHADPPHKHIVGLAHILMTIKPVLFATGRVEADRVATARWLLHHGLFAGREPKRLYMRADGDHRPDHEIKLEMLAEIRANGFEPIMVFEDRNSVVKMWREAGIPCAQVAEGDF